MKSTAHFAEERAARTAEVVARWRVRHPEASCSDRVAALLADLETEFGRGASVMTPVHVFSSLSPPTCETCGGVWKTLDAALRDRCEVRRAA